MVVLPCRTVAPLAAWTPVLEPAANARQIHVEEAILAVLLEGAGRTLRQRVPNYLTSHLQSCTD